MIEPIPKDREIVISHNRSKNVAIWSAADELFVYALRSVDMYHGLWNMNYFENEYIREEDIESWSEL